MLMPLALKIGKSNDNHPAGPKTGNLGKYHRIRYQYAEQSDLLLREDFRENESSGYKSYYYTSIGVYSPFNALSLDYSQSVPE